MAESNILLDIAELMDRVAILEKKVKLLLEKIG